MRTIALIGGNECRPNVVPMDEHSFVWRGTLRRGSSLSQRLRLTSELSTPSEPESIILPRGVRLGSGNQPSGQRSGTAARGPIP